MYNIDITGSIVAGTNNIYSSHEIMRLFEAVVAILPGDSWYEMREYNEDPALLAALEDLFPDLAQ